MKITGTPKVQEVYGVNKISPVKSVNKPEMEKDSFSVSSVSKDYTFAMKQLRNIPNVRKEVVDTLKSKISSGNYNISGEEILDKIENDSFDYRA